MAVFAEREVSSTLSGREMCLPHKLSSKLSALEALYFTLWLGGTNLLFKGFTLSFLSLFPQVFASSGLRPLEHVMHIAQKASKQTRSAHSWYLSY